MVAKNKLGGEQDAQSRGLPRRLASVDKKVRDRAVDLLASWLECRKSVEESDLRKIWKGLFYCYWHADKMIVQADLAERLASLLLRLPPELGLRFFEGFLLTMRREWGGIDHLRMDKFYLLQRKFVSAVFKTLRQKNWDRDLLQRYMDALKNLVFLSNDLFPAQGCSMHLAEIFLEELRAFLPEEKETFGILLEPFYSTLAHCPDKAVVNRVKEAVFQRLLKRMTENGSGDRMVEFVIDLPMENRLFELAASADTRQGNRKLLYALFENFKKLKRSTSGKKNPATTSSSKGKTPELSVKQDDPVVSNLEKKFEVAVGDTGSLPPLEMGASRLNTTKKNKKNKKKPSPTLHVETPVVSSPEHDFPAGSKRKNSPVLPINTASKKKKSSKDSSPAENDDDEDDDQCAANGESSSMKKVKKVRFALRKNTIWKPGKQSMLSKLAPLSLDLTPKTSALKKGLSPGPIRRVSPKKLSPKKISPRMMNKNFALSFKRKAPSPKKKVPSPRRKS